MSYTESDRSSYNCTTKINQFVIRRRPASTGKSLVVVSDFSSPPQNTRTARETPYQCGGHLDLVGGVDLDHAHKIFGRTENNMEQTIIYCGIKRSNK